MRWLVGLDLRWSEGAVRFAAWLARRGGAEQQVLGVHVVEDRELGVVLRYREREEIAERGRAAIARRMEAAGAPALATTVIVGGSADGRLGELARERGYDAIVIGRAARAGEHRLVRLGRVARRLLRRLPVPVVVVAPDLAEGDLGEGPVVALTRMTLPSVEIARFADRLGCALALRRAAVHVISDPRDATPYGLPEDALERLRNADAKAAHAELDAWLAAHGIAVDERAVLLGGVVEEASAFAARTRAPLLVAGARRVSGAEGVVEGSLARELAASAWAPVAVVPLAG